MGGLEVIVSGLPGGATANVVVTGPGGFSRTLTGSQTLRDVPPGSYSITAEPARVSGTTVDQFYDGSASGAAVAAGVVASGAVAYSPRPGSGRIWMTLSEGSGIAGYGGPQIETGGDQTPASIIPPSAPVFYAGIAFDSAGSLWVTNCDRGTIQRFSPSALAASGSPAPEIDLDIGGCGGVAFDAAHNLWVGQGGTNAVKKFVPAQLAAGSGVPSVTILASNGSVNAPGAIAFDKQQNLWVANTGNDTIVMFQASQLVAGGAVPAAVTLSPSPASLGRPFQLAFDAQGNLWAADNGNGTGHKIVMFAPPFATGSPTPNATIGGPFLNAPSGLAFDNGGNLWVTNGFARTMVKFTATQLANPAGVSAPAATINVPGLTNGAGPAFDPPPANSTIVN